uniref:BED-type domain-containing protein n=1 Tax=Sinocyclocheilus anshuiensis TaxID=1608454 RepID=A0A671PSY3_9TELE
MSAFAEVLVRDKMAEATHITAAPATLKADVWKHFGFLEKEKDGKRTLDKSYTMCRMCEVKIKYFGNTTNMRNHLQRCHADVNAEGPVVAANQATLPASILTTLLANSQRARKITKSIAEYIASDLHPYSVVEGRGFRAMMHTMDPRYKIPSRRFFAETVIPNLYQSTKTTVLESLKKAGKIALTCDAWTSVATDSYITVTAHYISDDWRLLSHVLQTRAVYESHTGANIADLIQKVAEEWQFPTRDLVLMTDNASNMVLLLSWGGFVHVRCYAHTLNLATQRALRLPSVARLLGKIRHITTFFHRSPIAKHQFEEKQKLLGLPHHMLKTDVITRWNSALDMVDRFLEQHPAISAALLSQQVRRGEADLCTLSELDISHAEDLVKALKPLKDATTLMSKEGSPTVSLIAPLHSQLIQDTKMTVGDSPVTREIKQAVNTDLTKRYNSEQEKNTLHLASALDPRFKRLPFLTKEDRTEIFSGVTAEAAALEVCVCCYIYSPPATKKRVSASLLQNLLGQTFTHTDAQPQSAYTRAEEEVTKYCSVPPISLSEDPLSWLAKLYMCIPGTSVSAESSKRQVLGNAVLYSFIDESAAVFFGMQNLFGWFELSR